MLETLKSALFVIHGRGAEIPGAPDLPGALSLLDQAARDVDNGLPPRLRHFLQNRSYQKALMFLEGEQPPAAMRCGNHDALKG